jgi:hypothetical protein
MSYLSSNPYVLNIVPLFNVADSGAGAATDVTGQAVTSLQTMVDTTTNTIYANTIQPFTNGQPVAMNGVFEVTGDLFINGFSVGETTSGINTVTGTSGVVISTSNSTMDFLSSGSVIYAGPTSTTSFYISTSILLADRAAIGKNTVSGLSTLFDVWGGDAYFDKSVFVNSNVYCQTLYQVSDERVKTEKEPLTGALSTLMELQGMRYVLGGERKIGFLAQDVARVVPEAVTEVGGQYKVDYSCLLPLVVEAIKEITGHRRAN